MIARLIRRARFAFAAWRIRRRINRVARKMHKRHVPHIKRRAF